MFFVGLYAWLAFNIGKSFFEKTSIHSPAKTHYFPFSFTKIHYYLNPKYFFRESQLIRLFIFVFTQVKDKEGRLFFEEIFRELKNNSDGIFERLYKSDIELFAELIDSNSSLLREKYQCSTCLDLMRGLEKHLCLLEEKHYYWILEQVFSKNPGFVSWFRAFNPEIAAYYESKYKKEHGI